MGGGSGRVEGGGGTEGDAEAEGFAVLKVSWMVHSREAKAFIKY